MTNYTAQLKFSSEREADKLMDYLTKALEKTGAEVSTGFVRPEPLTRRGAKPRIRSQVIGWIKDKAFEEVFTAVDIVNELNLLQSSVWRVLEGLVEAGKLEKVDLKDNKKVKGYRRIKR